MLQAVIVTMLVSLNIWAGLECTFGDIRAALADYGFVVRALILSVIVVPLVALLFSKVLAVAPEFATGIMLMAVAGGVPFLPLATSNAGGDMRASVSLVFLLSVVSIVTAPLTVNLLTAPMNGHELPIGNFIGKLALFQLLPLLVGMFIASKTAPALSRTLATVFRLITILAIVVLLVVIGPKMWQAFATVFATRTILAIALVIAVSMAVAWISGVRDHGKRVVLTDATGLRNPGIALLIASTSFPGPLTDSAIIVYLALQVIAGTVGGMLMKRAGTRP